MKKVFSLICLCLVALNLLAGYPEPRANAWMDDYSSLASMKNYKHWGTYNVHDPAVMKSEGVYYMYSTDAIFRNGRPDEADRQIKQGNIQVRSSKDLVHWNFEGWAFDSIPSEARAWVLEHSGNKGASNIWAPFPIKYKDKFRLYYCVSAFGMQTSYIGLVESDSPLGPWKLKGAVVRTRIGDKMNAIDPSVITDKEGKMWMIYGSYFGGLFAVELNPDNGLALHSGDQGHLVARRANYRRDNLEAPEIMYNPANGYYYLFVSYEPLMTTYNVRVGRSKKAEGPFLDYFGKDMKDTTNNYPILTYPYKFENHTGWAGTGHCGIISDGNGKFFMAHQARLSPENHLMDLHVREIVWTKDGWPSVSPERFMGDESADVDPKDIQGEWELVIVTDSPIQRSLEYGQILWGENKLLNRECNVSFKIVLNGKEVNSKEEYWQGKWSFSKNTLRFKLKDVAVLEVKVFIGQDWENGANTLLFSGIDKGGRSIWGKKIK